MIFMHNIRNVVVSFLQEWRLFFAPYAVSRPLLSLPRCQPPPPPSSTTSMVLILLFLPWRRSTPPLHASCHVSFPSNPSMVSRTSSSLRHVVADLLLCPTTSHATHILLSPPSRAEHSLASPQASPPIPNPSLSHVKTASTVFL